MGGGGGGAGGGGRPPPNNLRGGGGATYPLALPIIHPPVPAKLFLSILSLNFLYNIIFYDEKCNYLALIY